MEIGLYILLQSLKSSISHSACRISISQQACKSSESFRFASTVVFRQIEIYV